MRAKILSCSLLLFSAQAHACGEYELNGVVRSLDGHFKFLIAEKSKSQLLLSPTIHDELKLIPYKDRPVHAIVKIDALLNGTTGNITSVMQINYRTPDPLYPIKDSYLNLSKEMKCSAK